MPGASSLRRDVNTGVMAQAVAPNATEIGRGVVSWELTAMLQATRTRSVAVEKSLLRTSLPRLYRPASFLPCPPTPGHRCDVPVTHFLKTVRGKRRAESAAAVENDLRVLVGHARFDVALDDAFSQVSRTSRVTRGPLTLLTHIDDLRF